MDFGHHDHLPPSLLALSDRLPCSHTRSHDFLPHSSSSPDPSPLKLARFDTSFPPRHSDLRKSHLLYDRTHPSLPPSSGILLGYHLSSQEKPPPPGVDAVGSLNAFPDGPHSSSARTLSFPLHGFNANPGPTMSTTRFDGAQTLRLSDGPFTAEQWVEFNRQTYVLKYLAAGISPPPAFLIPIVSSVSSMNRFGVSSMHVGSNAASLNPAARSAIDPEPGRCRRTDGKKWRCAREVVPDQKYCERHMHRGRHRARAKNTTTPQNLGQIVIASTTGSTSTAASVPSSTTTNENAMEGKSREVPPLQQKATSVSNSKPQPAMDAPSRNPSTLNSPASSSCLGLSPDSQLQFSLQPAVASLDGSRSTLRSETKVEADQLLSSESTGLKRFFENAYGMGSSMMMDSVVSSQHSNLGAFNSSSTCNKLFSFPQVKNPDAIAKNERVNHLGFSPPEIGGLNGARESDDLPFRQFINDWPKSQDSPTSPWSSFNEDTNCSRTVSNTELYMLSKHTSVSAPSANSVSSRSKPSSPLRLSMTKVEVEDDDLFAKDPFHMGLRMGIGAASVDEMRRHKASWDNPLVGGPLAEVLQSSNTYGGASASLNLLGEGWDHHHHHHGSSKESSPGLASPTGVLQKSTFLSYSDSSSSGSSPRSALKMVSGLGDAISLANGGHHNHNTN